MNKDNKTNQNKIIDGERKVETCIEQASAMERRGDLDEHAEKKQNQCVQTEAEKYEEGSEMFLRSKKTTRTPPRRYSSSSSELEMWEEGILNSPHNVLLSTMTGYDSDISELNATVVEKTSYSIKKMETGTPQKRCREEEESPRDKKRSTQEVFVENLENNKPKQKRSENTRTLRCQNFEFMPDEESDLRKIKIKIEDLLKTATLLTTLVEKNTSIKIKDAVKTLHKQTTSATKSLKHLEDKHCNKEKISVTTQTLSTPDLEKPKQAENQNETICLICRNKTTGKAYQKSNLVEGNPVESKKDILIFIGENDTTEQGIMKSLVRRYPELSDAGLENLCFGGVIQVVRSSTVKINQRELKKEKTVTVIKYKQEDIESALSLAAKCCKGKVEANCPWDNTKQIQDFIETYFPEGANVTLNKQPGSKQKMQDNTGRKSSIVKRSLSEIGKKPIKKTSAVIVKDTGIGYAETLRTLKNTVQEEDSGNIMAVRKTRDGHVLLEVKSEENANALKHVLDLKGNGIQATVVMPKRWFHIRGLEPTVNEKEVEDALKHTYGDKGIRVTSIRPTYDGRQIATASVPLETAKTLANKATLRIGWATCTIRERIDEVFTCYRCWESGHRASECKGKDRTSSCRNCGIDGHMAKDCHGATFCPLCNKEGHRAGSLNCKSRQKIQNKAIAKLETEKKEDKDQATFDGNTGDEKSTDEEKWKTQKGTKRLKKNDVRTGDNIRQQLNG